MILDDITIKFLGCVLDGMWPADKALVPPEIKASIDRYVEHGVRTGSFLEAVLSNDLMDAYRRADRDNMMMMPAIIAYIYNDVPSTAHGSRETYAKWLENHPEVIKRRAESVDNVNG